MSTNNRHGPWTEKTFLARRAFQGVAGSILRAAWRKSAIRRFLVRAPLVGALTRNRLIMYVLVYSLRPRAHVGSVRGEISFYQGSGQ